MTQVCVIIPCYKDAATLSRALDSVYAQTHCIREVVVVNDCSPQTDQIEVILRSYPDVKYIKNTINLGLAATRNAGARAVTGDIISFLDADDELHPQKIEYQLSLYHPDIAVTCHVKRIGNETGIAGVEQFSGPCPFATVTDSRSIIRRNRLTGASIMLSRSLFLKVGGYDESLRSCEDFDLWLRLLDAGIQVYNIELPLYLYRVNEAGLSRNYANISQWELEAIKKYFYRHHQTGSTVPGEGGILAFWLMKHLWRYELCLDHSLIEATIENIKMLTPWPQLKVAVSMIQRLRVLRVAAIVKNLLPRNQSQ